MLSPEDYYALVTSELCANNSLYGIIIALIAPSLYIALTAYHPEMLPTQLALSIAVTFWRPLPNLH